MRHQKIKVAAIGDNCIDYYLNTKESFAGGNPVNVAVYSKRLGHLASYIGVVGDDENGKIIKNALLEKDVDISHIHVIQGKTAVTEVTINNGERIFGDYYEGVLESFKLTADDMVFAGEHDVIVSGIWGMIENDLEALKVYGKPIAFDFADKFDHEIVKKALPFVNYAFFASETEDINELKEQMRVLKSFGPDLIIVTLGERGSIAYDGDTYTVGEIVPCEVVDTMGAGDSFIAGFLTAYLSGLSIKESMVEGAKNSSITITYKGAW